LRTINSFLLLASLLLALLLIPAAAEVVYTPVNVSIAVNDSYPIDLNHDGVTDFVLRSHLLQDYCLGGDGYTWNLSVTPAAGAAVVVANGSYAAGLLYGMHVDGDQNWSPSSALLSQLEWGPCGYGLYGQWSNLPNRYLGLLFRMPGTNEVHYGWAKVSEVAHFDGLGHVHAVTILTGFAYETVAGRGILTGQTSEMADDSGRTPQ